MTSERMIGGLTVRIEEQTTSISVNQGRFTQNSALHLIIQKVPEVGGSNFARY